MVRKRTFEIDFRLFLLLLDHLLLQSKIEVSGFRVFGFTVSTSHFSHHS